MTTNQSKLRLIESDLLSYHVRRMDRRIGGYMRQLIEEEAKAEPDAGVLLRLRTQIKRDELSKFTPDVTEREVLEPLRAEVEREAALEQAWVETHAQVAEMETLYPMSSLGVEVHDALANSASGAFTVIHVGNNIDYFSPTMSFDEDASVQLRTSAGAIIEDYLISATIEPAEVHPTGKQRKSADATSKRRPPSRSVPSE